MDKNMGNENKFNRRDFLKVAGLGLGALAFNEIHQTTYPEAFIVNPELGDYIQKFSNQLGVTTENLLPICIQAGSEKFNFLNVPPIKNVDGTIQNERLFMYIRRNSTTSGADSSKWVELYQATGNVAGQDIVTWIYTNKESKPRPNKKDTEIIPVEEVIISYPILTPDQWVSSKEEDQLNKAMFFWPDSDSAWRVNPIMGYDRATDGQFIIPLRDNNDSFNVTKPLFMPTEYIVETPIPFDQMTDEEKLAMAPENEKGYKPDHTFKTSFVVYKDSDGKVQQLYDLSTKEWKLPKEAEYVTIEEWRDEIFSGTFISPYDGKEYPYSNIYTFFSKDIITNSTEASLLPNSTPLVILNPTGEVMIWGESSEKTAELVKNGAVVLVSSGVLPKAQSELILKALSREYLLGRTNLSITFNKSYGGSGRTQTIAFEENNITPFLFELMPDGRYRSPIVNAPKFEYTLYKGSDSFPMLDSLEMNEYWVDSIIKAGYTKINL